MENREKYLILIQKVDVLGKLCRNIFAVGYVRTIYTSNKKEQNQLDNNVPAYLLAKGKEIIRLLNGIEKVEDLILMFIHAHSIKLKNESIYYNAEYHAFNKVCEFIAYNLYTRSQNVDVKSYIYEITGQDKYTTENIMVYLYKHYLKK